MTESEGSNYHFKWDNHPKEVFSKFHFLYQQKRFVDVVLIAAQGRTLKAHRLILSASSQYFEVEIKADVMCIII